MTCQDNRILKVEDRYSDMDADVHGPFATTIHIGEYRVHGLREAVRPEGFRRGIWIHRDEKDLYLWTSDGLDFKTWMPRDRADICLTMIGKIMENEGCSLITAIKTSIAALFDVKPYPSYLTWYANYMKGEEDAESLRMGLCEYS